MKIFFFIVLSFFSTACISSEECHVPIKGMGPKLSVYMTKMFEERGISYKLVEENIICVSQSYLDVLPEVMKLFVITYLPENRSISADTRLLDRYQASFIKENIKFEKYIFDGNIFLVWDEKVQDIVAKLILEENNKFFSEIGKK